MQADAAIAACFYASGLSFCLAQSVLFRTMMEAVAEAGRGYRPPSATKIATTLLASAKRKVEEDLSNFHENYEKFGFTLASDGWTNTSNRRVQSVKH